MGHLEIVHSEHMVTAVEHKDSGIVTAQPMEHGQLEHYLGDRWQRIAYDYRDGRKVDVYVRRRPPQQEERWSNS